MRNNEATETYFKVENIVFYDDEFGIVREIPKTDKNYRYVSGGILIEWDWDTEEENNMEDCLGNVECFFLKSKRVQFQVYKSIGTINLYFKKLD